jgi:hypothetical protein
MTNQKNAPQEEGDSEPESLSPLIKAYIDKAIQESQKAQDKTRSKKWKKSWRSASPITKVTSWCTAMVAICTLVACLISVLQLNRMKDQNEIMQGTLDEQKRSGEQSTDQVWKAIGNINWMARSADLSQKVTKETAEASGIQSGKALNASIDNFHQDQRPWLGMTALVTKEQQGRPNIRTDRPHNMTVATGYLLNSGKTPAHNVRVLVGSAYMPIDYITTADDEKWIDFTISQIVAGKIPPIPMNVGHMGGGYTATSPSFGVVNFYNEHLGTIPPSMPAPFELPQNWFLGQNPPRNIILFGNLTYGDGRVDRHTTFCNFKTADPEVTAMSICPIYNDMQ